MWHPVLTTFWNLLWLAWWPAACRPVCAGRDASGAGRVRCVLLPQALPLERVPFLGTTGPSRLGLQAAGLFENWPAVLSGPRGRAVWAAGRVSRVCASGRPGACARRLTWTAGQWCRNGPWSPGRPASPARSWVSGAWPQPGGDCTKGCHTQ